MIFYGKQCFYNPFTINYKTIPEDQKTQKYKGIMLDMGCSITGNVRIRSGLTVGNEIDVRTMRTTNKSRIVKQNIGIEYKNECTIIDFTIERKNHNVGDLKYETSLQLVVHLKGLC
jgi:lipopolysaccharide assembly outer membrane protein LptD (OstA)